MNGGRRLFELKVGLFEEGNGSWRRDLEADNWCCGPYVRVS